MSSRALHISSTTGSATSQGHTCSASAKVGDWIVAVVNNRTQTFSVIPSGWSRVGTSKVFLHQVGVGEPGVTNWTWSWSSAVNTACDYIYVRGVVGTPQSAEVVSTAGEFDVPSTTWSYTGLGLVVATAGNATTTINTNPAGWRFVSTNQSGTALSDAESNFWERERQVSGAVGGETGTHTGVIQFTSVLLLFPTSVEIRKSAGRTKIEKFTASGTWTKPDGARFVHVRCVGGGGGGGTGRKTNVQNNSGGGGGASGGLSTHVFDASDLTATVAVTVGAGGAGGPANTANGTGNAGTAGGTSSFGTYLRAVGGATGQGGGTGSGTGGAALTTGATDLSVAGGTGQQSVAGVAAATLQGNRAPGSGGGGGGTAATAGSATAGGAGGTQNVLGVTGGSAGAANGAAGSPGGGGTLAGAGGGGSGGADTGAAGADGGAGGFPGGGGGGSGGCYGNTGAGGAGGNGVVVVETIF